MCDLDEYFQQKKAMGKRFKQFRELVGKSKKGAKTPEDIYRIFRDMKPTNHLINEIIQLNQQPNPEDFPKQKPQNWAELDGRMMW